MNGDMFAVNKIRDEIHRLKQEGAALLMILSVKLVGHKKRGLY